ncbi:MAG: hypothetical protein HeimC2_41060 [Candidatus Heimdallarchaeota archaeon LC_2]|nr:MAG: hypothetical protein HeimC2_41060 [Candidatus Heimdallarchaeota archaeon LC_2]
MKIKKSIFFLILTIFLISSNSNLRANNQVIPMQKIGEDTVGDETFGLDIVSAYAASFDGLLMLTVVYSTPGEWNLYSNITLRNSFEDLYFIQAAYGEYGNLLLVAGATSLEEDSKNANDGEEIFYTEEWRVHTNYTEITLFVDWADIGGEGPIDLVFWTGRPLDNPDKLPDTGHLSFDGVKTADTIGYLDDPFRDSTTIVGPTNSETTVTITQNITSSQTDLSVTLPLSNSFITGFAIVYLGYHRKQK